MIIGDQDQIIPNKRSDRLSRLWGGAVDHLVIDGAGHNDIQQDQRYWQAINSFLSNAGAMPERTRSRPAQDPHD